MIDIETMVRKYTADITTNVLTHLKADISTVAVCGVTTVDTVDKLIDKYIEEFNKGDNDK